MGISPRGALRSAGAWLACSAWPLAGQGVAHVTGPIAAAPRPVTVPVIEQRLHALAERFRAYAAMPRVVLFDIAFPKDSAECAAMSGYALLVVTAVSQHPGELPLRRAYVRAGDHDTALESLTWVGSDETVGDSLAARTFGRYREDALYLLPIALHAEPGAVVVDFAAGRSAFVVSQFNGLPDDVTWLPTAAPTARPRDQALLEMVQREYPGFVTR